VKGVKGVKEVKGVKRGISNFAVQERSFGWELQERGRKMVIELSEFKRIMDFVNSYNSVNSMIRRA